MLRRPEPSRHAVVGAKSPGFLIASRQGPALASFKTALPQEKKNASADSVRPSAPREGYIHDRFNISRVPNIIGNSLIPCITETGVEKCRARAGNGSESEANGTLALEILGNGDMIVSGTC